MDISEKIDLDFSIDSPALAEPEMPESFEDATGEEISEVLAAFRKRAKEEAAAKANNVSTDYWFAVYFASQNQRDAFLSALSLIEKMDDQYIAGDDFAKAVGVDIPKEEITAPRAFRHPANISDLILDL